PAQRAGLAKFRRHCRSLGPERGAAAPDPGLCVAVHLSQLAQDRARTGHDHAGCRYFDAPLGRAGHPSGAWPPVRQRSGAVCLAQRAPCRAALWGAEASGSGGQRESGRANAGSALPRCSARRPLYAAQSNRCQFRADPRRGHRMAVAPRTAAPQPSYRLIPSRFPPIGLFDTVAQPEDLAAVMELAGWTNDRLVAERLARLPAQDWVYGRANASIVMAAFLHAPPMGARFSGPE